VPCAIVKIPNACGVGGHCNGRSEKGPENKQPDDNDPGRALGEKAAETVQTLKS